MTPRTVVVTGAAGNLGRAAAEAFDRRGDNVVLVGRRASLERAYGAESARRMFAVADLLDADQLRSAIAVAHERFGDLHALCNLAGGFRMDGSVHDTADDAWQAMYDVNVRTLLNAVRAVVPRMLAAGRGSIVNVGSAAALKASASMAPYAASKSAVVRITEAMSAELKPRGINVNCVLPTTIDTPENRAAMPDADASRWVAPTDLATVIAFLASDEARAIHGAAIPVSGLA
jgi:NAD(P)-dependent dehydrogenase (short-subunit alcohol dehydrogenase family)